MAYEMRISDWSSDVCSSDLDADVITRQVDGYDLAQLLQDDMIADRFSTANLLRVDDNFTREVTGTWGTSDDGTVWLNNTVANTTFGVSLNGYSYVILGNPDVNSSIRLFQAGNTQQEILTDRSEEHTSELQSLMRISYAVFCLK